MICASVIAASSAGSAHALGVGGLRVQSGLGQPLKAQLDVTGADAQDADIHCFKALVETTDGDLLSVVNLGMSTQGNKRILSLSTRKNLLEPALKVVLSVGCEVQLHRDYLILLDPPEFSSVGKNLNLPLLSQNDGLASSAEVPTAKESRRIRKESQRPSIAANPAPETKKSSPQAAQKDRPVRASSATRDALKLSDEADVQLLPAGLKMADSLSVVSDDQRKADAPNIAELRLAQAQFAAMLRGENLPASAEKNTVDQKKIQILQQEAIQLKHTIQQDKAALEKIEDAAVAKPWFYVFSALILAGLTIIGLLFVYIQRLHKRYASTWWEQDEPKHGQDQKKNIEELVNDVQASYGPTTVNGMNSSALLKNLSEQAGVASVPASVKTGPADHAAALGALSGTARAFTPSLEDTNSSTFNFFSSRASSLKVEEISDVTQEAEFWMSVNDPERAIEILEPQAEQDRPDSPVPWLYLLDLYRVTKNKEKYDTLRDRFIVFFNANVPEFEVDPLSLPTRHLDDFEHLMNKICTLWNTSNILPFLESLLVDDRDGKRMGFELPVYRDILLLISVANELDRMRPDKDTSGWQKVTNVELHADAVKAEPDADTNVINFENIDFKINP